ncbi:MAG: GumC family protein [Acidobacteriota bacterium]
MSWDAARALEGKTTSVPAVQEVLAALWRQRRLASAAFVMVFASVIVFGLVFADRYEARMEILVDQSQLRRADPVLTGVPDAQPIVNERMTSSDETLNSEIALLQSQKVLQQVVQACGLNSELGIWDGIKEWIWNRATDLHTDNPLKALADIVPLIGRPTPQEISAKAVSRLADKLHIEVLKMSDVIVVTYRSSDPQKAARVLNALGTVYLKEHALAHRPPGELAFFQKQTDQARSAMEAAEQKLVDYTKSSGVASGQTQLQDALQRLSTTQANLDEVHGTIAGTEHRIHALSAQASVIPQRLMTEMKTSDSALLLQNLKSSLLSLQLKRTQLLTQYQPTYPLVIEVNKQIAETQAALEKAQQTPVQERTTDRDPNYEMVREDLTRSNADLAGLVARAVSLVREKQQEQKRVEWLQQQMVTQDDLNRNAKAAEDNYTLLLHKQEEAAISNQLDKNRIFNVSIVQPASAPVLPVRSAAWYVLCGFLLALLCSFTTAVGADRLDPTLRTPDEVELILTTPVLAALPLPVEALPRVVGGSDRYSKSVFT